MPDDEVKLAERLVRIEMSIETMRTDLARYFSEVNGIVWENRERIEVLEKSEVRHTEQISSLSGKVKTWSLSNSVAAAVAMVIGWFK